MNPWPFVTAAYGLTLGVTALLIFVGWRMMRAVERDGK